MPDPEKVQQNESENTLQTLLLLGSMATLLGIVGYSLFGWLGLAFSVLVGLVLAGRGPQVSTHAIIRHFKGRALGARDAPVLVEVLQELSRRADLPATPTLVYIPSDVPNAFAAGRRKESIVAVTDGLLRRLRPRELTGVLAHEVGHIRNGDLKVMRVADFVTQTAGNFSFAGKMLLLFSLPAVLSGNWPISPISLVLLLAAPSLSLLMQLALSRTREFAADLAAAELTGDPMGLASALERLHVPQSSILRQILTPKTDPMPSYLRNASEEPRREWPSSVNSL